jgi:hypothetical protein
VHVIVQLKEELPMQTLTSLAPRSQPTLRAGVLALTATLTLAAVVASPVFAAADLSYYLPADVTYADDVPRPAEVLGWEVGEWHVRHDQLVAYMVRLAERSDRVRVETVGRTHEHRPILNVVISSPANLSRLDEILDVHRRLSEPDFEKPDTADLPVMVYLGYSIHGNEASGSNASMLVAYHLAAAESDEVGKLLDEAVVIVDPSLNPDGLARFAGWANMHRGRVLVADPDHREHREGWPNGRTNHYWFDLNRDWLLAQHPESQARLERFHSLRPNVLADFHEMGSDATYFFQPGVPSRQNPLTPARNLELTRELARFHARALDRAGSLYYTEEGFDDFYFGKGSTYPDLHGAVGILFEQASARGHLQDTDNGPLSFPFAIRNHFLTSLSTLAGAHSKRRELLDYQADFYRSALAQAADDDLRGYAFGDAADPVRAYRFVELLRRHRIEVYELGAEIDDGPDGDRAWVVPVRQRQYRLVRALFEKRLDFQDKTFYDVSTWTAPLAFDLEVKEIRRQGWSEDLLGERVETPAFPAGSFAASPEAYAYAFEWGGYYAPRTLYSLQQRGVRARVALLPLTAVTAAGERALERGTVIVPVLAQGLPRADLEELLAELAERDGIAVHTVTSGLTPAGPDLGGASVEVLEMPRPALVVGRGLSTYAAGEIWHLLDHHFGIALSLLEADGLVDVDLDRYTHLVLADGNPGEALLPVTEKIGRWVQGGGVLVAMQGAAGWAEKQVLRPADGPPAPPADASASGGEPAPPVQRLVYADHSDDRAAQRISGAIFTVELDLTHPLAFGYRRETLPVFRNATEVLEPVDDPYATVAVYSDAPLQSGYVSPENYAKIQGSPAVVAERHGAGAVVRMVDDPNHRAFWYGTHKLFLNSLFFGSILDNTSRP